MDNQPSILKPNKPNVKRKKEKHLFHIYSCYDTIEFHSRKEFSHHKYNTLNYNFSLYQMQASKEVTNRMEEVLRFIDKVKFATKTQLMQLINGCTRALILRMEKLGLLVRSDAIILNKRIVANPHLLNKRRESELRLKKSGERENQVIGRLNEVNPLPVSLSKVNTNPVVGTEIYSVSHFASIHYREMLESPVNDANTFAKNGMNEILRKIIAVEVFALFNLFLKDVEYRNILYKKKNYDLAFVLGNILVSSATVELYVVKGRANVIASAISRANSNLLAENKLETSKLIVLIIERDIELNDMLKSAITRSKIKVLILFHNEINNYESNATLKTRFSNAFYTYDNENGYLLHPIFKEH